MPEVSPLPVRVEPLRGESGLGFLLRAARANGLSLGSLFDGLGFPKSTWLSAPAFLALSRATEVEFEWLQTNTVVAGRRDGYRCLEWKGRLWACPLALRGARPQVCPECLRDGRPCMLDWELTGAVACMHHRCCLVDACVHCGRRLSWWRPAIDVCTCGHFLTGSTADELIDAGVMGWIGRHIAKACGDGALAEGAGSRLPRWLDVLSPDGLLAVSFVFGVRREPLERVTSAAATVPPSTPDMTAVIERGVARLERAGELRERCPASLRLQIYDEGLQRLWLRGVELADRSAAAGLLQWLGYSPRGHRVAGRARGAGQVELFGFLGSHE